MMNNGNKSIVERLDDMENDIAKLNEVREIKTIINNMKEHDSMLVHK
jgi:hypothetical protein